MKKFSLLLLMWAFSLNLSAQNYRNDGKPYDFYCVLNFEKVKNLEVKVIWNNWQKKSNQMGNLMDENGEIIKFPTTVDLLNYMSKRGWELVFNPSFPLVHEWGGMGGSELAYAFLFKKMVISDEEAKEGLYFSSDFKK